eukprot:3933658-Rhodomonas_salina.1
MRQNYESVPTSSKPGDAGVPVYSVPQSFRAIFRTLQANLQYPTQLCHCVKCQLVAIPPV